MHKGLQGLQLEDLSFIQDPAFNRENTEYFIWCLLEGKAIL